MKTLTLYEAKEIMLKEIISNEFLKIEDDMRCRNFDSYPDS